MLLHFGATYITQAQRGVHQQHPHTIPHSANIRYNFKTGGNIKSAQRLVQITQGGSKRSSCTGSTNPSKSHRRFQESVMSTTPLPSSMDRLYMIHSVQSPDDLKKENVHIHYTSSCCPVCTPSGKECKSTYAQPTEEDLQMSKEHY